MKDPEDVVIYRKFVERLKVHIFLAGLDEEFDQVRGEILRKDIITDLEECCSFIRRDKRENVWQNKLNKKVDSETFAMIARQQPQRKLIASHHSIALIVGRRVIRKNNALKSETFAMIARQQPQRKLIDKSSLNCTHCRKKGHTKEQCFEIIGYPDWWDTRKKNTKPGSKTAIAESTSTTDLKKESLEQIATCVSPSKALKTITHVINSTWIIDSGASDHMTFDSR